MEGLTRYTKVVMRIIRMEDFKRLPKKRKHKRPVILFGVLLALGGGFVAYQKSAGHTAGSPDGRSAVAGKSTELKKFSNDEFRALAASIKYPNTQLFAEPSPISGNAQADERIRTIAEDRGYHPTSIPVSAIVKINEPRLEGDDLLQPLAAMAWQELKTAAQKDGIPLSILSAYRSPDYQRDLFMKRLLGRDVSVEQIAAGQGDAQIQDTLDMTAVPGYSRHHTGYTIDLWCEDRTGAFLSSRCYKWISANNYQKAKETGWIPGYPGGVMLQGPEPEPWEYVWVGKDLLRR